jgi:hypothetical protein
MANFLDSLLSPQPMQYQRGTGAMPVMPQPQMQPQQMAPNKGMNFMRDLVAGALLSYGGAGVGPVLAGQQNRRRREEEMLAQNQQQAQLNATKQWLKAKGREDLIPLVDAGQASDALRMATQQEQGPDLPAIAQEYEYAKQNGFQGSFMDYQAGKQRQGAGVTFGTTPQWGQDSQTGEWGIGVLGSDGSFKKVQVPDNFDLAGPEGTAAAKSRGTEIGKIQGGAAGELPGASIAAQESIRLVDDLLADPALPSAVGPIDGNLPGFIRNFRGGVKNFDERVEQLKGKAFLVARQELKGGGQITDYEGQRAEAALIRAGQAKGEDEFRAAMLEFKDAIMRGYAILEQQASGQVGAAPQATGGPVTVRSEQEALSLPPGTEVILNGRRFRVQ